MAERTTSLKMLLAYLHIGYKHTWFYMSGLETLCIYFHQFSIRNQPKTGTFVEFIYKYEEITYNYSATLDYNFTNCITRC